MNVKISNWAIFGILLAIGLLIFALMRGCNSINSSNAQVVNYKERAKKLEKDSIEFANKLADNATQIELLQGQQELADIKDSVYIDSFRVLSGYISYLKNKYKPVVASVDTNVTMVPNEYIEDCAGCFMALDKAQQLGLRYKSELDNKDNITKSKIKLLDNRISLLEKQNTQLGKSYRSLLDSSKGVPELRRTLFATAGVMAINQYFPNAIGGGFLYEDKKRRIFGAKYYISRYGSIYQGEVSFPLSLKFK